MATHLGHIRTKYVFFVFLSKRKSMDLFPQVKLCLFPQAKESVQSKKYINKALNIADVRDQLISKYFEQGLTQKQILEALEFR